MRQRRNKHILYNILLYYIPNNTTCQAETVTPVRRRSSNSAGVAIVLICNNEQTTLKLVQL